MPYQYHYEIERSAWVVTVDGQVIKEFMIEGTPDGDPLVEAAAYCAQQNGQRP